MIELIEQLLGYTITRIHPCLSAPVEVFMRRDENHRNPKGDRKSIVSNTKILVEMVLERKFLQSISNGD